MSKEKLNEYEKKEEELRYNKIQPEDSLKNYIGKSKFKIKEDIVPIKKEENDTDFPAPGEQKKPQKKADVPIRRFGFINEKIKYFPLKENDGNVKLMDFDDGCGEVYAYRWKNDPGQGWISFWAQFENDENIEIDAGSTISSSSYLFAKNGKIKITGSNIINTQIWAKGDVIIQGCAKIKDSYIFGSVTIISTILETRTRIFTNSCIINSANITGNNLFLQDEVDSKGSINISDGVTISGNCEIIGSVSLGSGTTVSGKVKISGKVSIVTTTISDNVFIHAGKSGSINISTSTLSDDCIIINNAKLANSSFSKNTFIGDNVNFANGVCSGNCIILDNANLTACTVLDNSLINMQANATSTTFSDNAVMTGSSSANGATISGNGILSGKGTSLSGGSISGNGRVFNGVACTHGVSGEKRHWDSRSCDNDDKRHKLTDEREGCISPDGSDCEKEMPPPTIN